MRITSLKLSVLALVLAAFAIVPAASADTVTNYDLFVGSTQVATAAVSVGSICGTGNICITFTGVGGNQIRTGGPTVGLSGASLTSLGISLYTGSGTIAVRSCGGMVGQTFCFQVTGQGANGAFNSITLVLNGATNLTSITGLGLHIIGPACGTQGTGFATCFTTSSTPVPSVPEPGTLGLLGTGLVGIAGLIRRRFSS